MAVCQRRIPRENRVGEAMAENVTDTPAARPVGLRRFFGFFFRPRRIWVPRWYTTAGALLLSAALFAWVVSSLYSFLAVSEGPRGDLLVVEGWIPDHALRASADEFDRGGYRYVCATGGPLVRGSGLVDFETFADLAGAVLLDLGAARAQLVVAPAPAVARRRSYQSALSLRGKLTELGIQPRSLTIATLGPHARRSRLMYERVFGEGVSVGVLAMRPESYDPDSWWRSSAGAKAVLMEAIAYIVERFSSPPLE